MGFPDIGSQVVSTFISKLSRLLQNEISPCSNKHLDIDAATVFSLGNCANTLLLSTAF